MTLIRRAARLRDLRLFRVLVVALALCAGPPHVPRESGHGGAELSDHRQQGPLHQRSEAQGFPHPRRRNPAEDRDLRRRQQAAGSDGRGRHLCARSRLRKQAMARGPTPTHSSAPTCSCCSTPATICIAASSTPPTRSPISSAAWTAPIRWRSTPTAGICRAPAPLTQERNDAIFGLRKAVAGDDSALYNCLLLTLRDAAKVPGRKVVIVFSNGPDNASMVAPDDVRAVAEDEGIPIYVISTNEVNKDPISSQRLQAHLDRAPAENPISPRPGRSRWRRSRASARIWATPTPSPIIRSRIRMRGSARSPSKLVSDAGKKYRVQCRPGYRPRGGF